MKLIAKNLSKRYGTVQALHDVSLSLDEHEIVGFLGPNGAGKSTSMKIMAGFVAPSSGKVIINGIDAADNPIACRQQIGYLPQQLPLYPDMTVSSYLDHCARLKNIPKRQRRREVVEAIEACQLEPVANRHLRKLSGGNQQRAGLAQALLGRPPILILDEPTAGLDPTQVARFRRLLIDLSQRHSILLSTHILSEVELCAKRVIVVHEGRSILEESVDDLCKRSRQVTRVSVRFEQSQLETFQTALSEHKHITMVSSTDDGCLLDAPPDARGLIIDLAQTHGGLRELVEERRSLEDVFSDLIANVPAEALL